METYAELARTSMEARTYRRARHAVADVAMKASRLGFKPGVMRAVGRQLRRTDSFNMLPPTTPTLCSDTKWNDLFVPECYSALQQYTDGECRVVWVPDENGRPVHRSVRRLAAFTTFADGIGAGMDATGLEDRKSAEALVLAALVALARAVDDPFARWLLDGLRDE